ncbi:hypothetical protein ASE21_00260 [Flavobacterium sp. Root901]|nr:hypothetical protein ASE21_00260 [Flavobacterium sp. Root901]
MKINFLNISKYLIVISKFLILINNLKFAEIKTHQINYNRLFKFARILIVMSKTHNISTVKYQK